MNTRFAKQTSAPVDLHKLPPFNNHPVLLFITRIRRLPSTPTIQRSERREAAVQIPPSGL